MLPIIKISVVVFALFALTCSAFVPTTKHSVMAHGHYHLRALDGMAFEPLGSFSRMPTTTLSMVNNGNLFDRFTRVVKSNINKFVSSIENPEKVIVQAVDDMQTDLIRIRQAYSEAVVGQRRLQREKDQVDAIASDWYRKAQLAVERGNNEGLAREALQRRQLALDKAATLQSQMNAQGGAVDKLYSAINLLEGKIREAASTKEQLIARARTAKSTAQVNDMLSGLTGKTSMDAFVRMEQKVEALEAAAEVSAEMTLGSATSTADLEMEFLLLEQSSKVDEELAKLKKVSAATTQLLGAGTGEKIRERVSIPVGRGETINIQ